MVQFKHLWRDSRGCKSLKEFGQESAGHLPLREHCTHKGVQGGELDFFVDKQGVARFKCSFCGQMIKVQEK